MSNNILSVDFKVFIAGVQIPDSRVDITTAFNAIPTCTVSMPPDPRLVGIGQRDRVPVQVFVSDTLTEPLGSRTDVDYLLLFDGEVTSYTYQSSELNKMITVTAEAIPGFFRAVQMRLLTSFNDLSLADSGDKLETIVADANLAFFPASLFLYGIGDGGGVIKYPHQFLKNVVDFIQNGDDSSPMFKYYRDYCTKIRMSDRHVSIPHFDDENAWGGAAFPILQGLQDSQMYSMFTGMSSAGPLQESIFNLINYVVSSLEYEWSFFGAPAYIAGDNGSKMVSTCLKPILYEALPPACNYLFKSHIESMSLRENVMEPPTRVLLRDVHSAFAAQALGQEHNLAGLAQALLYSFWPTNDQTAAAKVTIGKNTLRETLLTDPKYQSEEFCGPRVFETTTPPWVSYLGNEEATEGLQEVTENVLKHIYFMKQYEHRQMDVTAAFNPYITPGFPGVAYDVDSLGLSHDGSFMGHVLVVNHSLSKDRAATNIQMGFARTLAEESRNPLPATLPAIDDITRSSTKMNEIYAALLGPEKGTLDIASLVSQESFGDGTDNPQFNPFKAYQYIKRNIMTLTQYQDFMPGVDSTMDADGHMSGTYFTSRWDTDLVQRLKEAVSSKVHKSIF